MSEHNRWLAEHAKFLVELAVATMAAGVAIYVRGLQAEGPSQVAKRDLWVSRSCEALVCGFFAGGLSALMDWTDSRATYAVAAGLAYIGVAFVRDLAQRIAAKKVERL